MRLVLVTGMSGAGKSVALKTLEDCGFEAVDNLPLSLIPTLVAGAQGAARLAIGIDIRARDFSPKHVQEMLAQLRALRGEGCALLYMDCDDDVLARRFSETRRRHPLAQDRSAVDGIKHERALIADLRGFADAVIDTSENSAADTRRMVAAQFGGEAGTLLSVQVCSFSYRHGVPREADMVFDMRFLRNPHYDPALRDHTGREEKVGEYIAQDPAFAPFFSHVQQLILPLLPRFREEGKSYLTLAFGCTGGKHRSVYMAEKFTQFLQSQQVQATLRHRDLPASGAAHE